MKIYHTETQADYDALMIELEEQGCKWLSGRKPTDTKGWVGHKENTCIRVSQGRLTREGIEFFENHLPHIPITKYKAKVNEMKFTKENVEKVINEYFRQADFEPCGDLIAEIHNLDDTPEKAVVPKFVAEWYESQTSSSYNIQGMIGNLLNGSVLEEMVLVWLNGNYSKYGLRDRFDLLALIRINGYTIEPEQLYYIPLPDLKTSDGIQQVLTKRSKNGRHYFASRPNEKLKQRYTKEELERVPEIYKPYAKPIEEES